MSKTPRKTTAKVGTDKRGPGRPRKDPPPKPYVPTGRPFHGVKGRSGAPKGNQNAARHYMTSSMLPKHLKFVEHKTNAFRRSLETEVMNVHGAISVSHAAAINTATKFEKHGALAAYYLRTKLDTLSPSDYLKFSEAVAKASASRDKAIARLQLDRTDSDTILEALYSKPKITAE